MARDIVINPTRNNVSAWIIDHRSSEYQRGIRQLADWHEECRRRRIGKATKTNPHRAKNGAAKSKK